MEPKESLPFPLYRILSQMNSVHILTLYLYIRFNIIFSLRLGLTSFLFLSGVPTILYQFLISPCGLHIPSISYLIWSL
jgi:hypothetical protein